MDTSNVCPTEDAIQAFLDYLVEPMLPSKYSIWETPTLDKQQAVAKQVHAVVLLYNYYHRKRHPHLEHLGFEPFCKLALVAKPNLKSYMNLMLSSDDTELSDLEKQLSLTEKAIKDACDISTSLDASRDVPSTKGWPVSKVAIFLIDLWKENCALQNGSIAEGVWSMIEKDVPVFCCSSDGSTEAKHMNKNPTKKKHMNKRKRIPNEPLRDEFGADESSFQQVAFSAVKEATNNGISQSDLTIIESHVVYSLSKEKTATRFYIMQSIHAEKDSSLWIPIKDVIDSLQGPLVKKNFSHWMHSSAVEYFHLLPFVRIISQWFLRLLRNCGDNYRIHPLNVIWELLLNDKFALYCRDVLPNSSQDQESVLEVVNEYGPEMTEKPCEPEACNNRNRNMISGGVIEALSNSNNAESENENEKNELCTDGLLYAIDGPWNMDVNNNFMVCSEQTLTCKNLAEKVQHDAQLKMNSFAESDSVRVTNVAKFEVVDSIFQSISHSRKAACKNMPPCQDGMPTGNHAPLIHKSNSKYSAKLQNIIASKEHILSETAWRVLHRKRDELVRQLRNIGDEIAQCDKKIQTIVNGGEDDLELKIDLIIEGCNDVCLRSASQGRTSHDNEDPCSTHYIERNRLSEEALSTQNPCQELDGICNKNNWMLPTYHVFPSDGGYQAKVTVKGVNIESSSVGDACPKPSEARGSAAAQMLAKLLSMLTPAP